MTTFLVPNFKKEKDKVNNCIEVISPNILELNDKRGWCRPSIATTGFSASVPGVYAFAVSVKTMRSGVILVGFTDTATFDAAGVGYAGGNFAGTSLNCFSGHRFPRDVDYLPSTITSKAHEIICIFKISPGAFYGYNFSVQFIVDSHEGTVIDCTKDFGRENIIFPSVSLGNDGQQVEFIPFDQIKFRSPVFDKYFSSTTNQNQVITASSSVPQPPPTPPTAAVAQLQQELDNEKKRTNQLEAQLQLRDQELASEKQNSASKDQQLEQEKKNNSILTALLLAEKQDAMSHLQHKDHQLQLQEQLHRQKDQLLLQEQQRNRQASARLQQYDQLIQQQTAEIERLRQTLK